MKGGDSRIERLVRLLDGTADAAERAALEAELAADPGARRLLRDLAEQAVAAADRDRTGAALAHDGMPPVPFPGNPPRRHRWIPAAAAAVSETSMQGFGRRPAGLRHAGGSRRATAWSPCVSVA